MKSSHYQFCKHNHLPDISACPASIAATHMAMEIWTTVFGMNLMLTVAGPLVTQKIEDRTAQGSR